MFLLVSFESFITARPPGTTKGPLANYYVVDISSLKPNFKTYSQRRITRVN